MNPLPNALKFKCVFAFLILALMWKPAAVLATEAPDPTAPGPYEITSSEYRLPARVDPLVDKSIVTELWARIYRPKYLMIRPYPVVVFLHGNHGTCGRVVSGIPGRFDDDVQYTDIGTCPRGYSVVRSHEGYAYAAESLASWGYFVVSINANRGINGAAGAVDDLYLNTRRGRLVLRHLELLDQWNRTGGAPKSLGFEIRNTLDFSEIGLMGHSRGGEGVLAAYNLFKELGSPWPARFANQPVFRGIFAIAPVTNQTSRPLFADNIPWAALLPLCDGDVYTMDALQVYNNTMRARFEVEPGIKAIFGVWGANHNFYNTEWQQSDAGRCVGRGNSALFSVRSTGSSRQRQTGLYPLMAFFRSQVGHEAERTFANIFNPSFKAPQKLASLTNLERIYAESAARRENLVIDDFSRPTGFSWRYVVNRWSKVKIAHRRIADHGTSLKVNAIQWSRDTGINPRAYYFQSNGWTRGKGRKLGGLQNLEFRVSLACQESSPPIFTEIPIVTNTANAQVICDRPFPENADGRIDFSVSLVTASGRVTRSVPVSRYARLHNPVGGKSTFFSLFPPIEDFTVLSIHPLLQTVRIPLADFGISATTPVRGVRFSFDQSPEGSIYLANVRFSRPSPERPPAPRLLASSLRKVTPVTSKVTTSTVVQKIQPARRQKIAARNGGVISSIRPARNATSSNSKSAPAPALIEVSLSALHPIPVRNALLKLQIGNRLFMLSRFATTGDTTKVTFSMTPEEYGALSDGANVELIVGPERLAFGKLNKASGP
jgi:hypothetical protein